MFISSSLYASAYQLILSRARGSPACTTYLLVSPDVDALCAARLLSGLLKTDDVAHQTIPVGSWAELAQEAQKLRDEDVRNLILLNLGASADLYALFGPGDPSSSPPAIGLDFPSTCMIHILDSHRPINLRNLFEHAPYAEAVFEQARRRRALGGGAGGGSGVGRGAGLPSEEFSVVVWDEVREKSIEEGGQAEVPFQREKEAYKALEYEPPSDSEDSSSESDQDEDEDGDGDEHGDGPHGSRRKRRRTDSPVGLTKIQRRTFRERLAKYEARGSSYGQSVATMVYLLAQGLGRADIDSVWLAILGLTYQFSTSLIDHTTYTTDLGVLGDAVAVLSSTTDASTAGKASSAQSSTSERDRSIRESEEFRFCLFRHWNLYDAMFHSGYLGGKLNLWTDRGRRMLNGMLAKMGLSLSESSETYAHMSSDLKSSLFSKLEEQLPAYALYELTYKSFVRKSGWRIELSAADYVDALGAMLEAATGVRLDFASAVDGRRALMGLSGGVGAGIGLGHHDAATQNNGREEWAEGIRSWVSKEEGKENRRPEGEAEDEEGMSEKEKRERRDEREKDWRKRNFWLAWDALDPEDTSLLRSALPLSMALHRSITSQGAFLLEKQSIRLLRTYRLAVLSEGPDLPVFQHPATLLRLANWLTDAIRMLAEQRAGPAGGAGGKSGVRNLPLVCASLNEGSDKFLVVGVCGAEEFGDVRRNRFGRAFEEAAMRSRAKAQQNYFDASVVEVRKGDFDKFLKDLAMQ
ncbi:hypothetical protein JCM1841_002023 [Sporobolomyces salmonicolor]